MRRLLAVVAVVVGVHSTPTAAVAATRDIAPMPGYSGRVVATEVDYHRRNPTARRYAHVRLSNGAAWYMPGCTRPKQRGCLLARHDGALVARIGARNYVLLR